MLQLLIVNRLEKLHMAGRSRPEKDTHGDKLVFNVEIDIILICKYVLSVVLCRNLVGIGKYLIICQFLFD